MGRLCYPTQASGQSPGTLARKLSRCKPARPNDELFFQSEWDFGRSGGEGMARVFAVMVQILLRTGANAVQFLSMPENCQGISDLNCEQWCVSGCNNHYKIVLSAGVKAKTMTNNLPILSVLAIVIYSPIY